MEIIYQTRGKAGEFAPLALELYTGCYHGCRYCYVPDAVNINRATFHKQIKSVDNALFKLTKDAKQLKATNDSREILMGFESDPYQSFENTVDITRQAIEILVAHNLRFTILTKGGTRAKRDFNLLEKHPKASFGSTLLFLNQNDADIWEPNTPKIEERIKTMENAHKKGIRTWVSLEPVIDPEQSLQLIKQCHPYVDHWKIGKINYHPEIEKKIDWIEFREEVITLLESLSADYYIKKSLTNIRSAM